MAGFKNAFVASGLAKRELLNATGLDGVTGGGLDWAYGAFLPPAKQSGP